MSIATSMRSSVRNVITKLGSTITLTPRTYVADSNYPGYAAGTYTESTEVSTVAVPARYMNYLMQISKMGDLTEGEVRIVFKDSETIDGNDKVTFQSVNYQILRLKRVMLQDVNIAIIVDLKEMIS